MVNMIVSQDGSVSGRRVADPHALFSYFLDEPSVVDRR
jgi:hypothetical protein